jgi:AraC-like DNA-binding protein
VERAVAYILKHLDEPIDPVSLAAHVRLSRHHFHRVFLALLGETVGAFTRRMRLERAALQLRSTPTSITEVAFGAGYATHEAFIRAIRLAYDCTPSGLRWSHTGIAHLPTPNGIHYAQPIVIRYINMQGESRMNELEQELLIAFELHSTDRIQAALDAGQGINAPIQGKSPVNWLLEMYSRSDRFADCLRLLLDRGATLDDPIIAPMLLNDVPALKVAVQAEPELLKHRTNLISTFTPLLGASLLHVAAEYGHLEICRALIELGAEVDARADLDAFGYNGHTPLFHTVNSSKNRSEPIMRLLLEAGANPSVRLAGITWGKGFEWATTLFDVTPISYAQFGLLPQVHRKEEEIYANIRILLEAAGRSVEPLENIPNRYLQS